ncbi:hypothetical protein BJV74DRAFT_464006 [Russula compacta]|nr:hypothetical protein BJV74DRAFT_464006 [Russula compacta]
MEPLLPQPPPHYGPWSYHDHVVDYPGDSHITAHNVNGEQGSYQHLQYGHFNHQGYVIAQNEVSHHAPLSPPDASMSYWLTSQGPTTTSGPPVLPALPVEPMYYTPSCYDNQDLSPIEHRHATTDDLFQPTLPGVCGDTTYGTTSLNYAEPDATLTASSPATALPAPAPHPTIAHDQSESGHDPVLPDATTRSALYEGNATFRSTDPRYTQIGLYGDLYTTAAAAAAPRHQHYTPTPAKEDRQSFMAASPAPALALDAQGHYVAPAPGVGPASGPALSKKPKTESPGLPPRARSPMDHLPYPEDLGIKTEGPCRHTSGVFGAGGQQQQRSPSPASTPTPTLLSPILQTQLTFITYPETEPRALRDGRGGGGGGGESDEHGDDDDGGCSPSRRGRRGKKQPKKDPFLACFFCRGRKIACHPKNEGGEDRTCTQCAKRHLPCQYPLTSRRGQRKSHDPAVTEFEGAVGSSAAAGSAAARATSRPRVREPSRLSTSSLVSAA